MSEPKASGLESRQESDARRIQIAVDQLQERGFAFLPGFLRPELTRSLREEADQLHAQGVLRAAGVGKGNAASSPQKERNDVTLWWEKSHASAACLEVFEKWSAIQEACNRELYLGLWDLEAHWAVYPPGGFYRRHVDRFRNDDARTLSAVLYLNPADWRPEDGGELRIWTGLEDGAPCLEFLPSEGALVLFLSDRIPHEVCVTHRTRYSVAAWFRKRT